MSASIQKIAIVGVTGTIGAFLTSALLAKKRFIITAISRKDSRAEFPAGIGVARVDYDDLDSITNALKGQDALIITTSAAAAAAVPWIFPNEFGMHNTNEAARDTIGAGKEEDRMLIESLGVSSWIGISCGFWYEHSLSNGELYGIDINRRKVTFFDDGKQKLNTSTWPQVGRAVGALLSLPLDANDGQSVPPALSSYRNNMVYVSSFAVSQRDMFDSVKRVTCTTDDEWQISSEPAKQRFADACEAMNNGDRLAFGRKLYTRYFYEDAGLFERMHGLDNEKLGLPKEDLDESTKESVRLARDGYWAKYGQH